MTQQTHTRTHTLHQLVANGNVACESVFLRIDHKPVALHTLRIRDVVRGKSSCLGDKVAIEIL